ncbi:MAG TPA: GDP-mannose 4,6-dehydratase [Blastocatellia bacterium]
MTNVLVTGGAGFIGSHLVDRLLREGDARVTVVDNFNDFYDPAIKRANIAAHIERDDFELVEADIADAGAMNELFRRRDFDCVVHLAARAGVRPSLDDPLAYEETNVRGTFRLLEAARRSAAPKFIFGSSSSVYGINSKAPFSEAEVANPISPYAATKLAGEAACCVYSHLYDLRVVCLRLFTVYGARQRPDLVIHKFAKLITEGKPLPVFGDGTTRRDYTYIDDITDGIIASMKYESSSYEVINLGGAHTVDLRRIVDLLEQALGKRAVIEYGPTQPGDVPVTYADIDKARRLLAYDPKTQIEEGVTKFVEWFQRAAAAMSLGEVRGRS